MDSPRLPADRIGSRVCHCAPPGGESPPDLSLRGSAGAVAISQYTPGTQESPGEFDSACLRFPRRFAPRNDKLGSIARSAKPLYNLPACKALNPRKGDAASVRRQSRQRLRSERRYRRNRFVRYDRRPVRAGSASPRLHPKGTSSRFALRAPRRPLASSQ